MNIIGIIPARYASTRFPAKALADIEGKTMIQRVYEQALKSKLLLKVVVATDNELILKHVEGFGGTAIMTSEKHQSGTDRCYEVLEKIGFGYDFVINIQGDEPFIQPEQIDILVNCLEKGTELATLVKKIDDNETLFNTNTPKVIFNTRQEAIYFSRNTIPFFRGVDEKDWLKHHDFYKHLGIYAYRADILEKITQLPPSNLENAEKLEQLRWLENGFRIKIAITEFDSFGIDTPEDLERALSVAIK
jgi:3-deoxy-manno-octulosonate cytidylyltransferase (CMP-KDO synthetase)